MNGNKSVRSAALLVMISCMISTGAAPRAGKFQTRREFVLAISSLKEGVSEQEVVNLLGRPDQVDVVQQAPPRSYGADSVREIWRYGTSGDSKLATLGRVYIDFDGRVDRVIGKGSPPPGGMFDEQELRDLMQILYRLPSYAGGERYNPREVIRSVNALQPLGKEKALAAIAEFLRVIAPYEPPADGIFLVLRTLFDVPTPPGYMPLMNVGALVPPPPDNPAVLPRFPIAIEGDIPFLLVTGFNLAGGAELPAQHLKYFQENGQIRSQPLTPTTNPFEAIDTMADSPRWIYHRGFGIDDQFGRRFLGDQALRLMDSVYRVEPGRNQELLPADPKSAARRQAIIQGATKLAIQWDTEQQLFTFLDGTTLPEPKQYDPVVWHPEVAGIEARMTLHRTSAKYVSLEYFETIVQKKPPAVKVRLFKVNSPRRTLASFTAGSARKKSATVGSMRGGGDEFQLNEGDEVVVELTVDNQIRSRTNLTP